MRSTNATESESCDPPKPRLMTLCPGNACARFFQSRMLELPMNSDRILGRRIGLIGGFEGADLLCPSLLGRLLLFGGCLGE